MDSPQSVPAVRRLSSRQRVIDLDRRHAAAGQEFLPETKGARILVKRCCESNRRELSSAANPGIHRVTRTALPGVGAGQSLSSLGTRVTGARNARNSHQEFIETQQISIR